jgi:hypothetical protein
MFDLYAAPATSRALYTPSPKIQPASAVGILGDTAIVFSKLGGGALQIATFGADSESRAAPFDPPLLPADAAPVAFDRSLLALRDGQGLLFLLNPDGSVNSSFSALLLDALCADIEPLNALTNLLVFSSENQSCPLAIQTFKSEGGGQLSGLCVDAPQLKAVRVVATEEGCDVRGGGGGGGLKSQDGMGALIFGVTRANESVILSACIADEGKSVVRFSSPPLLLLLPKRR